MQRSIPLFNYLPELQDRWVPLIGEVTPVYQLRGLEQALGCGRLFVKREDMTDSRYGGNKVRNLEFLLGDALARKTDQILGLAPLGSNFIAALSAQSARVGLPVRVHHFMPTITEQMQRHAEFSQRFGADLRIPEGGYLASLYKSSSQFVLDYWWPSNQQVYRMPTGGSSALGAMGHLNAFLELLEQIQRREIPSPEVLVVGAGTCGNMAGLLAGKLLTNSPIEIIGIRCVDQVICNRYRIAFIANQVLKSLGVAASVSPWQIDLRDEGAVAYGSPTSDAHSIKALMQDAEGLLLDTTYTTKVVSALVKLVERGSLKDRKVLYWHTFSSAAMIATPMGTANAAAAPEPLITVRES